MAITTGLSRAVRQVGANAMAPTAADIKAILIRPGHSGTYNSAYATAYATGLGGDEVASGNGYTQGGQSLTTRSAGDGAAQDQGWVDYADVVWTAVGSLSAVGCGFWDATNSRWVGFLDFGGTRTATDAAFTVQIPASGVGFVRC